MSELPECEVKDPWATEVPFTQAILDYYQSWPPENFPEGSSMTVMTDETAGGLNPCDYKAIFSDVLYNHRNIAPTGTVSSVPWFAGHFTDAIYLGPRSEADVVVVGKMPASTEVATQRLLTGASGQLLEDVFGQLDLDWSKCYITNICRFPLPKGVSAVKAAWIKDGLPFLMKEIELVNPKALLLLGSDALKVFFKGRTLTNSRGALLEWNGIPTVCSIHPAAVCREPGLMGGLVGDVRVLQKCLEGDDSEVNVKGYFVAKTLEETQKLLNYFEKHNVCNFAFDCEWGYSYPNSEEHLILRSMQFAWGKKATNSAIVYLAETMNVRMPQAKQMLSILCDFLEQDKIRLTGHHLRADIHALAKDPMGRCLPQKLLTGDDTMLMHYLLNETGRQGLEVLALKYTSFGRYDEPLHAWIAQYKKEHKMNPLDYGYAYIPTELLEPYAILDVLTVTHAYEYLYNELQKDPALFNLYKSTILPVGTGIFDMERNGIRVDMERGLQLTQIYENAKKVLHDKLCNMLNWPEFNPRSIYQIRSALFKSTEYQHKKEAPEGALCLDLVPIATTDKPKVPWQRIVESNRQAFSSPNTDDETLDILSTEPTGIVKTLRYYRVIDQLTKSFLRPPIVKDGQTQFDGGLLGKVWADGRIHTTISQLKETGRWSSSKPNLQALPKAREKLTMQAIKEVTPEADLHKLRTIFIAEDGYKLIEGDFAQAELNVLSWLSNDTELQAVLNDPERNMHAEMAVKAFSLDTSLQPDDVKAKHSDLYVAAKSVNFGIAYKRGADALSRETGQSVQKCREMITLFGQMYHKAWQYLEDQERAVAETGILTNPYGRKRRFYPPGIKVSDQDLAAMQREGRNFPIQSTVADALSVAMMMLWKFRHMTEDGQRLGFRLILAIHDAILFEVPNEHVDEMVTKWIPYFMSELNIIPQINRRLQVDIEVFERWTEDLKKE